MTSTSSPAFEKPSEMSKVVFGMPVKLFWGYIAIAIFMTGDGVELAFLSKYIIDIGFNVSQSAMVFTVYAITAAIASWLSGGISEIYGPRKIMALGVVWWVVFHVLFIHFGLAAKNYPLILVFYALRGFAYPLFFYAFYVLVVQRTPSHRLASATGWIWSMFTIGYGIIASFLPSVTIPLWGFLTTLWMSLAWVIVGGAIALLTLKELPSQNKTAMPGAAKLLEISRGITLIFANRDICLALIIRILCNLALFGFPIFMPLHYTSQNVGFTPEQWMRIWGIFFLVQPVTNVLWGIIGDRIGWLFQMRWVGFFGCTITTLLFYFMPLYFPANLGMAIFFGLLLAFTITSFVPMGAIFPMLAPEHKGAAISVQNLGGGIGNFIGPAIATVLFSASFDIKTVVICYSALYFIGGVLTWFIRNPQPARVPAKTETDLTSLTEGRKMNLNEFFGIKGKIAVVTGASAGIGLAITELMIQLGATVVMVDKDPQVVVQAVKMTGDGFGIAADLSDIAAIPALIEQVIVRYGRIDILVNNAGIGILEAASEVKKESWDATLLVNLTAPYFLSQAAGKYMIAQQYGRIVNIASQASVIALENHAAYCTSKAGLVIASKVLAAEWGQFGITVNTISPTVVETELGKRYWQGERAVAMTAKIPAGRFAMPDEIAGAVAYLVSDKAGMITGENLIVDGGYTII